MGKNKIQNVKHRNQKTRVLNSKNPRLFFKQIGIKPLVKPDEQGTIDHIEQQVLKRFGSAFFENRIRSIENSKQAFSYYHSDLDLVKIWYGADYNRICNIASDLANLDMPVNCNILDVGGGPGHLSFWMANIWNPSNVTVADINPIVGQLWADEIKESRVSFVKSRLPELEEFKGQNFDTIFLSRILSAMDELNLPDNVNNFQDEEVRRLLVKLEQIGKRLSELVTPQGQVVVIDSWSSHRILLVGKAFEKAGLLIDLKRFNPQKVGLEPSIIVFSKSTEPVPLSDLIYSLSTAVQFPLSPPQFSGTAAESLRVLFGDGKIRSQFECESKNYEEKLRNEIIEKEGLILAFRYSSLGLRAAWIFPGIYICELMRIFDELQSDLSSIL
jgi:hypothetical protein